ncbi:MAG TPA: ABC transporter substrate-binding protein [Thermodesulfobacteriota bacterium]|nr:ABC transporter substrate-binding protein [Thermodesulfobacteriota bacterium]
MRRGTGAEGNLRGRGRGGKPAAPRWPARLAALAGVASLLAATAGRPAVAATPGVTDQEITLGMTSAFKGHAAGLGTEIYRGAMAYFAGVNEAGGVHGRRIVIKAYDDGYEPDPAVVNTVRLIQHDRVFLLFGNVGTPTTTKVLPLLRKFERERVYLWSPFTGAQPHREPPYVQLVVNIRASYRDETAGLVRNLVQNGRRRIGIFYQDDAYGRSGQDGVTRELTRLGLKPAGEASYPRGTRYGASMAQQVAILRQAGADAVVAIGAYEACAAFIRDARNAGWQVPIANVSFVGADAMLKLLLAEGQRSGRDYTSGLVNSQVVPSYDDTSRPLVREYREAMAKYAPRVPEPLRDPNYTPEPYGFVSLEGYVNARVLVEVLKRAGRELTREGFMQVVDSLEQLDIGLGVPITFKAPGGGHRPQGLDEVFFTVVRGGRWVPLTTWREVVAAAR